jgi:hypothetical protein
MLGVSLVFSGVSVKAMINRLGLLNFTTVSNMSNALSMLSYSYIPPFSTVLSSSAAMWLGLVFAIPGARKRDAVEALIIQRGAEQGFGRGFLSGSLMNWKSVINIIGPVLFGSLYTYGAKRKFPGLVFFVGALSCFAAEGVVQMLPKDTFTAKKDDSGKEAAKAGPSAVHKSK